MIRPQELRIGNYVWVGKAYKVDSIISLDNNYPGFELYISDFEKGYIDYDYAAYAEPISITEEWLLMFGFNKIEYHGSEYLWDKYIYEIGSFGGFFLKDGIAIPKPYYFADAFSDSLKIQYVHQLQNIYFALTGEELTLNK